VKKWIEELKAFNKNTVLAIAGNKKDLMTMDIETEEVFQYAEQENAKHFFTSAKTGEGLDEIFSHITKELASKNQSSRLEKKGSGSIGKKENKKITISKETSYEKVKKEGCCK
jgi:Ras-related protein Rab-21